MNNFQKRTAIRIASVSILLACLSSPLAWFVARENSEESVVALAIEESGRLLHHFDAIELHGPTAAEHAVLAAKTIAGGMFDIAEIYDVQGTKLAESMTGEGAAIESILPKHGKPAYRDSSYESLHLTGDTWVLRVFVPLRNSATGLSLPITGYFEGVRVVPERQRAQIWGSSLSVAWMVGLASLLCGAFLYPVVVHLSRDNERKAREVLDSHISMMEALGRAIAKRDSDTGAHNYRVAWIAAGIAEKMGMEGKDMQALIAGSFLHEKNPWVLRPPWAFWTKTPAATLTPASWPSSNPWPKPFLSAWPKLTKARRANCSKTGYAATLSCKRSAHIFLTLPHFKQVAHEPQHQSHLVFCQYFGLANGGFGGH